MSDSLIALQEDKEPYRNFYESLRSDDTKIEYKKGLSRYLLHYNLTPEKMLTFSIGEIEKMLVDYLLHMKKKQLSSSFINLNFCALKHFYFMNDVRINKEKIGKFMGEKKKKNVDRSYTRPEIKSLLDIADLRVKVIVAVLASTGVRIGSLPSLKLSHLEKKEGAKIYKFIIYQNTKEEYYTFCSPETASCIDSYLEYRTRSGEKLNNDSFLIREQFDINDFEQIRKEGRSVSKDSISSLLYHLAVKAGVRIPNLNSTGRERQAVPLAHGFRKFFTTQLINAKVNPEIREMLLGHSIGLAGAYYKPTEDEMLEEYLKAADNLTINEENRLRKKVEKLEFEMNSFEQLSAEIREIRKEMKMNSQP